MLVRLFIYTICLCFVGKLYSQSQYVLPDDISYDKIDFEMINNVILIPVEVNGLQLKFLLDTGVSKPIVFNFLKASDSLQILNAEKIEVRGLGNGSNLQALRSSHNVFKIGEAVNKDQAFFAVFDPDLNFAPKLGKAIDGIIGYDVFKDFVVQIDYNKKHIKIYKPERFKYKNCKKYQSFDLTFNYNKPFLSAKVDLESKKNIPVNMLLDSGSSDAIWLFENDKKQIVVGTNYFTDYLGAGLSGSVYGKRSKIEALKLGDFVIKNPKVAFPDLLTVSAVQSFYDRNGSLGGEILKRFNCIFDYPNSKLYLKPNSNFRAPFSYNKSGLLVEHSGVRMVMEIDPYNNPTISFSDRYHVNVSGVIKSNYRYQLKPTYVIYQIVPDSPAEKSGLLIGDRIVAINKKLTENMSLDKLNSYFFQESGQILQIKVDRNGFERQFKLTLKSPLE